MKQLSLFLIAICLFYTSALHGQERVNKPLPTISQEPLSQLSKATGWILSPEKQWISRPNRIPAYIENEFKAIMDFEQRGLGTDNFISYSFRKIVIEDSTYIVFIKKFKNGTYQYPTIKKGWTPFNSAYYYIIDQEQFEKLKYLKPDTNNIIKLKIILSGSVFRINNETFLADLKKDIVANYKKPESERKYEKNELSFHIAPYPTKNIVQFQIYILEDYGYFTSVMGIMDELRIPDEKESWKNKQIYGTNLLFKYCYYEVDLATFNGFIKLNN